MSIEVRRNLAPGAAAKNGVASLVLFRLNATSDPSRGPFPRSSHADATCYTKQTRISAG